MSRDLEVNTHFHTYIHTYIRSSFLYSAYKFDRVTMRLIAIVYHVCG